MLVAMCTVSLLVYTFDLRSSILQTMLMLRDVATRHRPVAIVTDLRSSSQLREMARPTKEELSKVSPSLPLPLPSLPLPSSPSLSLPLPSYISLSKVRCV